MATVRLAALVSSRRLFAQPQPHLAVPQLSIGLFPSSTRVVTRARFTTSTSEQSLRVPKIDRSAPKLFQNADAAVADLKSGSTILSSGFGLCGVAGMDFPCTPYSVSQYCYMIDLSVDCRNVNFCNPSQRSSRSAFFDGSFEQCWRRWERRAFYFDAGRTGQ